MRSVAFMILSLPFVVANIPVNPAHHPTRQIDQDDRALTIPETMMKRAPPADDDDNGGGGLVSGILRTSSTTRTSIAASTVVPASKSTIAPTLQPFSSTTIIRSTTIPSPPSVISSTSIATPVVVTPSASTSGSVAGSAASNGTSLASSMIGSMNATSSASSSAVASSTPSSSTWERPTSVPITTVTTDASGQTAVITLVYTQTASDLASKTSAAEATTSSASSGSGISTPAIVGISVAVGLVLLTLVGCALWRMKRKNGDEDEAIRWPELNRHGDATTHHALPARRTGQHGFETNPLERSLSNASSIFAPSTAAPLHSATPMALNGSNFGAASSLEDYDEKLSPALPSPQSPPGYEEHDHDDYTSVPPAVQMQMTPSNGGVGGGYDSGSEDVHSPVPMLPQGGHVSYPCRRD